MFTVKLQAPVSLGPPEPGSNSQLTNFPVFQTATDLVQVCKRQRKTCSFFVFFMVRFQLITRFTVEFQQ